ncbi:hypothetical protein TNCV_1007261 [Trichonephila clavipes]|nr:hypothetical protein TNCV_1007261 [Trichonephila clavipes]
MIIVLQLAAGVVFFESCVQVLAPLKTRHVEELMGFKFVRAQSSDVSMVKKLEELDASSKDVVFSLPRFQIMRGLSPILTV